VFGSFVSVNGVNGVSSGSGMYVATLKSERGGCVLTAVETWTYFFDVLFGLVGAPVVAETFP
jgi:hypothetical protein